MDFEPLPFCENLRDLSDHSSETQLRNFGMFVIDLDGLLHLGISWLKAMSATFKTISKIAKQNIMKVKSHEECKIFKPFWLFWMVFRCFWHQHLRPCPRCLAAQIGTPSRMALATVDRWHAFTLQIQMLRSSPFVFSLWGVIMGLAQKSHTSAHVPIYRWPKVSKETFSKGSRMWNSSCIARAAVDVDLLTCFVLQEYLLGRIFALCKAGWRLSWLCQKVTRPGVVDFLTSWAGWHNMLK